MGKIAFLFPGQGSQFVGMAEVLLACGGPVAETFAEADATLGFSLSRLMREGPEAELTLTENSQPALVATGLAAFCLITTRTGVRPDYVAGHSLGEYAAIAAAGGMSAMEAIGLVRQRGRFMQAAAPVGSGTMAAMLGMTAAEVEAVCRSASQETGAICVPANYNNGAQIVISGDKTTVERAVALAKQAAKRCLMLPVSAPFHSPLMQPAAVAMGEVLASAAIVDPAVPVIANVTAREATDAGTIRRLLVEQITAPVLWEASMRRLIELGVDTFVEVGSGKVLTGLLKRIDTSVRAITVNGPDDLRHLEAL